MEEKFPDQERRENLRYHLETPCDYSIRFRTSDSDEYLASMSGNIGLGGILLLSASPFDIGKTLDIEISFDDDTGRVNVLIPGKVIWVDEKDEESPGGMKYYIGAQFDLKSEDQKNLLIKFMEKYITFDEEDEQLLI